MSDTANPGPLLWNARINDPIEAVEGHLDGRQAQIHTSMPGTIVSYNPQTMTATVQPALQVFHTKIDGTTEPVTMATISDVPVHFPGGGGHVLTFPVRQGDDCWLVFSERSIDNWFQHGGVQQPSDHRMHDINDPVCHVGVRSQPNVPNNVSQNTVQLRSDDGNTLIDIDGANGAIKLTAQNVTTGKSGGNVGFYGTSPIAKPTVTGTQGTSSTSKSIAQAGARLGLWTDNST